MFGYILWNASQRSSVKHIFNDLLQKPHHEDDGEVNPGLEHDRPNQRPLSKRRKSGNAFAINTAFPTTSAAVVATKKLAVEQIIIEDELRSQHNNIEADREKQRWCDEFLKLLDRKLKDR